MNDKKTAVEWLESLYYPNYIPKQVFEQAKEMESKEKLKHQLFIGKVNEILGFDKTVELLKQCNKEIT